MLFIKYGVLQIKNSPVNIVTVTAARLFRCFEDSVGPDDASFMVQITKLMKLMTGGIPSWIAFRIVSIVVHIFVEYVVRVYDTKQSPPFGP